MSKNLRLPSLFDNYALADSPALPSQPRVFARVKWLQHTRTGRFDTIPDPFAWNGSIAFAHLLKGYEVAQTLGITTLGDFANAKLRHAESTGRWAGTPLELWLCLFFEHRRARHGGGSNSYAEGAYPLLDALCRELRASLQRLPRDEALLMSKLLV